MYKIWTDGSFKSSINQGGYSAIITEEIDGETKIVSKLYEGFKNTTNNRMELLGALEAMRYFKTPSNLTIYSDSQYVVNSIENKYLHLWIKNKDLSKKNMDIWKEIYKYVHIHTVKFIWVKGHNKNKFNELADLYACHAAECLDLKEDIKYETNNIIV